MSAFRASPYAAALCLLGVACSPAVDEPADGTWRGETGVRGDRRITTTHSGSVWAAPPRLELTAVIGLREGPDPYLLGLVGGLALGRDGVAVLDLAVPAVRLYDRSGTHLRDLASAGPGPGELAQPDAVGIAAGGRVLVRDRAGPKIEVFAWTGDHLETWRINAAHMRLSPGPKVAITPAGRALVPAVRFEDDEAQRVIWRYGGDGVPIEPRVVPSRSSRRGEWRLPTHPPFVPQEVWNVTPTGDYVLGTARDYELEILRRDGSRLVLRHEGAQTIPIEPEERAWHRRKLLYEMRRANDPTWTLDGRDIPAHKPSYAVLLGDTAGRTWVVRQGPGIRVEPCDEHPERALDTWPIVPCWVDSTLIDVFDSAGRLLGSLGADEPVPFRRRSSLLAIHDDHLAAYFETAGGVPQVRLYRLVVPAGDSPDP